MPLKQVLFLEKLERSQLLMLQLYHSKKSLLKKLKKPQLLKKKPQLLRKKPQLKKKKPQLKMKK
jgi:hypothetical protein